ncbi:uncharacterized protein LOC123561397 isoform X2 [Mercenaria mercenaria]|nr:uncharacterized protein LOC123561397 isoform X2 [Mercenaria mercenaria]
MRSKRKAVSTVSSCPFCPSEKKARKHGPAETVNCQVQMPAADLQTETSRKSRRAQRPSVDTGKLQTGNSQKTRKSSRVTVHQNRNDIQVQSSVSKVHKNMKTNNKGKSSTQRNLGELLEENSEDISTEDDLSDASSSYSNIPVSSDEEEGLPFGEAIQSHINDIVPGDQQIQGPLIRYGCHADGSPGSSIRHLNQSVFRLLEGSLAPATAISYRNAFKRYTRFHTTYYPSDNLLPISTAKICQFIAYCHDSGLKGSSITSLISALAYIHNISGWKDPSKAFVVKKILFGLRKLHSADNRLPISYDLLVKIVKVLPQVIHDTKLRLLCQTMWVLAFFALLRIGELTVTPSGAQNTILLKNVRFQYKDRKPVGASLLLVNFKHSHGMSATVFITRNNNKATCPARLLHKYIRNCHHKSGPLFCVPCGRPVTDKFFRSVWRDCIQKCNLNTVLYTPHCLRIGSATHAYERNMSDSRI